MVLRSSTARIGRPKMSDPTAIMNDLMPKEPHPMNPHNAMALAGQRRQEIAQQVAESRRGPVRRLPRWRLTWTRTKLSPVGRGDSSLVIIISAHRA